MKKAYTVQAGILGLAGALLCATGGSTDREDLPDVQSQVAMHNVATTKYEPRLTVESPIETVLEEPEFIHPCDGIEDAIYFSGNCYKETKVKKWTHGTHYGAEFPRRKETMMRDDPLGYQCSDVATVYRHDGKFAGQETFDTTQPMVAMGAKLWKKFPRGSVIMIEYPGKDGQTYVSYAHVKDTGPWKNQPLTSETPEERKKEARKKSGWGPYYIKGDKVLYGDTKRQIDLSMYHAVDFKEGGRNAPERIRLTKLELVRENVPKWINTECSVKIRGRHKVSEEKITEMVRENIDLHENPRRIDDLKKHLEHQRKLGEKQYLRHRQKTSRRKK